MSESVKKCIHVEAGGSILKAKFDYNGICSVMELYGFHDFVINTLGRFVVQVLMPNKIRGFVFQKLFRK